MEGEAVTCLVGRTVEIGGVAHIAGDAGGLILSCTECGRDAFRDRLVLLYYPRTSTGLPYEPCWSPCSGVRIPVREGDVDLWARLWAAPGVFGAAVRAELVESGRVSADDLRLVEAWRAKR